MVAVANTVSTDYKSAESPQTQPVESRTIDGVQIGEELHPQDTGIVTRLDREDPLDGHFLYLGFRGVHGL
ncbi:hypothetical protein FACS189445_5200 [Spirochaetia bacterium]|nr:hypothetical protein FACS189445_5200 [Spirochaetia bacterium]